MLALAEMAGKWAVPIFALWEVTKWELHEETTVEFRKNLESLGGAAAGAWGGGEGGALALAEFEPVGPIIGGLGGAIIGGILGAKAAAKLDGIIMDKGEDLISDAYEFFGWYHVTRNTHP